MCRKYGDNYLTIDKEFSEFRQTTMVDVFPNKYEEMKAPIL